jgi:hypothetical protein
VFVGVIVGVLVIVGLTDGVGVGVKYIGVLVGVGVIGTQVSTFIKSTNPLSLLNEFRQPHSSVDTNGGI